MGLPRYIVNYSEVFPFIQQAISEAELSASASGIDFSEVTSLTLNSDGVNTRITSLIDINTLINVKLDELNLTLKDLSTVISDINKSSTEKLGVFGEKLQEKLDNTIKIRESVQQIADQLSPVGEQRIEGFYKYVPPGRGDYTIEFVSDKEIFLTAITYSQIGWKFEDTFSFLVDGDGVFKNISTKEVAEKKRFNRYMKVPANTKVEFVLHNNSGNSRQIWLDIEYVLKP
jgi:hypothetical protein